MRCAAVGGLKLSALMICPTCGNGLSFAESGVRACCARPNGSAIDDGLVAYDPSSAADGSPEVAARDMQAAGYLTHSKFPVQIDRLREFTAGVAGKRSGLPILDLGCGPGPTTQVLLEAGFNVVAIDFSRESLRLNAQQCGAPRHDVLFVVADLNRVVFGKERAGGLMMADFLQHLGGLDVQKRFLEKAFDALVPGGWYFLSMFNASLPSRLRGDIEGSFSDGSIPYRRATLTEARAMLPESAVVDAVLPMNVFHGVALDRLAAVLPFARHFARWTLICGHRGA